MIMQLAGEIPVTFLCKYFAVSTSGYYQWMAKQKLRQETKKMTICKVIKVVFKESKETYGSPRIFHSLPSRGITVSENTVAKYMKEMGLDARLKNKFRIKTTDSNHNQPIAARIFKVEDKLPNGPNQVLAGDITYLRLGSCFFYLAVVLDLFNRKIVGWAITDSLNTLGALKALEMALQSCGNTAQIIFHSDRGVQYASKVFLELLVSKEMIPSMSRKGNCYDNAFVESWFKSLKSEWLYRHDYKTEAELRALVFEYIEVWYHRKRLHSSLGYQSPLEYEIEQLAA